MNEDDENQKQPVEVCADVNVVVPHKSRWPMILGFLLALVVSVLLVFSGALNYSSHNNGDTKSVCVEGST